MLTAALAVSGVLSPAPAAAATSGADGSVVSVLPLDPALRVPGTAHGYRVGYVSRDGFGHKAVTTGEVLLPAGRALRGG